MRWLALPLCAVMSVACAKTEKPAAAPDTAAALAPATPAAPAADRPLADVAGKWNVVSTTEKGDSLARYVLTATDETTGWTIQFAGRSDVIPVRVRPDGDSIIMSAGPFKSAVRKNVTTNTAGSWHLVDGKLTGRTVAHYDVKTPDSVLVIIPHGTRVP